MAGEDDLPLLENLLNKATSPALRDEDWEHIIKFCDQVNKELEGPQIAVRLIAHKIQSPQERESLFALTTLEACVKNCGRRFHQEIGKFRFLNEIIKVVSPKYLGNRTSEKVKKKCIEVLYSWNVGLKHENKIGEAYQMLKTQGIVKEDPTYLDKTFEPPPPPRPKNAVFEDDDKSKLLARLLRSKNPDDLQAANRLIKNMVKQDSDRMDKVSRRINELETINNNVKLLTEMLEIYNASQSTESEKEMMKEIYETLEKLRPNLFRLASDADEKDGGITDILTANDSVMKVMNLYKKKVEGITEGAGESDMALLLDLTSEGGADSTALLDLSFDPSSPPKSPPSSQPSAVSEAPTGSLLLDEELLALGIQDMDKQEEMAPKSSHLNDLSVFFDTSGQSTIGGYSAVPSVFPNAMATAAAPGVPQSIRQPGFSPVFQPTVGLQPALGNFTHNNTQASGMIRVPVAPQQTHTMSGLDILGKSLLEQNLGKDATPSHFPSQPSKIPLNQMQSSSTTAVLSGPQIPPLAAPPVVPLAQPLSSSQIPSTVPGPFTVPYLPAPGSTGSPNHVLHTSSPASPKAVQQPAVLTDLYVPLETVQPGEVPPINAYDKNGLKIVIHVAKNRPREDVSVMVVSVMSTNSSPVKTFTFQAAVPKVMRVKLQSPSATDLPAYNPILPPAAITQVMLLANPQKEKVRLKFKITYMLNEDSCTDVGEVDTIPKL